jgi:hypothetical protein
MSDAKNLYDRVLTAQAEIETVKNQINEALAQGTPEGDEQAFALESKLDESIANEARLVNLYTKMTSANDSKGRLKNFTPVQPEEIEDEDSPEPKVMPRVEFEKLNPVERKAFVKNGGSVQ